MSNAALIDQLHRRRDAAQRLAVLDCGCADPSIHSCNRREAPELTDRQIEGYAAAVEFLASQGLTAAPFLPELRALWRTGHRKTVEAVTSRWVVAR